MSGVGLNHINAVGKMFYVTCLVLRKMKPKKYLKKGKVMDIHDGKAVVTDVYDKSKKFMYVV